MRARIALLAILLIATAGGSHTQQPDLPRVPEQTLAGIVAPVRLPDYVSTVRDRAVKWQSDAQFVGLDVRQGNDRAGLRVFFYSPATRKALYMDPLAASGYQVLPQDGYSGPTERIPAAFTDFPQALEAARRAGLRKFDSADLTTFAPDARTRVMAWVFRNGPSPIYVSALDGAVLAGDVSGNRAYMAEQMRKAGAAYGSFLDSLRPRPPAGAAAGAPARRSCTGVSTNYSCEWAGCTWYCPTMTADCYCTGG